MCFANLFLCPRHEQIDLVRISFCSDVRSNSDICLDRTGCDIAIPLRAHFNLSNAFCPRGPIRVVPQIINDDCGGERSEELHPRLEVGRNIRDSSQEFIEKRSVLIEGFNATSRPVDLWGEPSRARDLEAGRIIQILPGTYHGRVRHNDWSSPLDIPVYQPQGNYAVPGLRFASQMPEPGSGNDAGVTDDGPEHLGRVVPTNSDATTTTRPSNDENAQRINGLPPHDRSFDAELNNASRPNTINEANRGHWANWVNTLNNEADRHRGPNRNNGFNRHNGADWNNGANRGRGQPRGDRGRPLV